MLKVALVLLSVSGMVYGEGAVNPGKLRNAADNAFANG
jgi:hypothetical protein